MIVIDYNGVGRWSLEAIINRYLEYARELGIVPRQLSPRVFANKKEGRRWIYPLMNEVIEGIEAGDPACVRLSVEFIEEDSKFPFGRILKSKTARVLRRATLTEEQRDRIRRRVLGMLRAGTVPHEFREYARLVKKVGYSFKDIGDVPGTSERVSRFRSYLLAAARNLE